MSSAIYFSLDQCKTFLSGNGLKLISGFQYQLKCIFRYQEKSWLSGDNIERAILPNICNPHF